ncbi:MAG: amino acid ABC transporter permease [Lachnospiraceae bacterium]|nr:amino acid ABC transporter permease [Lachnospiraceae bacterium]MDY6351806.1 amino acid ABC transporter permease [Lachnospiraceae bacterium]
MLKSIEVMRQYFPALMSALPATMELLLISVIIALFLGLLLAWGRLGKNKAANVISYVIISFMRGTPMMVQLLLVFILIPLVAYSNGIDTSSMNPSVYAIISFSINEACFFAEIFRSAYMSIDNGQIEAATSLGMGRMQIFRRVILPQGAIAALPNTSNMIIELMKNTSIASVIGVYDILGKAQQLGKNNYGRGQLELYIEAGIIFWILGLIILSITNLIQSHISRCDRKGASIHV